MFDHVRCFPDSSLSDLSSDVSPEELATDDWAKRRF